MYCFATKLKHSKNMLNFYSKHLSMLFRNKYFLESSTLGLELNHKFPVTFFIVKRYSFCECACIHIKTHAFCSF